MSTFDLQLYKTILEVKGWKKLVPFGAVIPPFADDLASIWKEKSRILRE